MDSFKTIIFQKCIKLSLNRLVLLFVVSIPLVCKADKTLKTTRSKLSDQRTFQVCGKSYKLEVAKTFAERNQGLMYRREIHPEEGMIFIFSKASAQTFWMKNVPIGLDILFFSPKGLLLNSMTMSPASPLVQDAFLPRYSSLGEAQFVVELKEGSLLELAKANKFKNCVLRPLPKIDEKVQD